MDEEQNEIKKYLYGNKRKKRSKDGKPPQQKVSKNQPINEHSKKAVMADKGTQTLLLSELISMQASL